MPGGTCSLWGMIQDGKSNVIKRVYRRPYIDSAVLVERFQAGEIEAFDEIVDKYQRDIYRTAHYFTHNCEDAYDISQEVFLKVFRSLSRLRRSSTFDAWLRKITTNTCIDHLRQQSYRESLDNSSYTSRGDFVSTGRKIPFSPMEMAELRSVVSKAVEQLPKKQKAVFVLRHYEDLSLDEIARTLRCPLGTVKSNLFHARNRLRNLLSIYVS